MCFIFILLTNEKMETIIKICTAVIIWYNLSLITFVATYLLVSGDFLTLAYYIVFTFIIIVGSLNIKDKIFLNPKK